MAALQLVVLCIMAVVTSYCVYALTNDEYEAILHVQSAFCPSGIYTPPTNATAHVHNEYKKYNNSVMNTWLSELPVTLPSLSSWNTCCGSCSFDTRYCEARGTCCLGGTARDFEELQSEHVQDCRPMGPRGNMWMHARCPQHTNANASIVIKCENEAEDDMHNNELHDIVPVYNGKWVYKNRYCAYCHNITDGAFSYFRVIISCTGDNVKMTSPSNLLSRVQNTNSCKIEYRLPENGPSDIWNKMFTFDHLCKEVISECNVTGNWQRYDPVIEAACQGYVHSYLGYKNVFCYLCNTNDTEVNHTCSFINDIYRYNHGAKDTFTAILNFLPTEAPTLSVCPDDQIHDFFTGSCLNVTCHPSQQLVSGKCEHVFRTIGGQHFTAFLMATPTNVTSTEIAKWLIETGNSTTKNNTVETEQSIMNQIGSAIHDYFKRYFQRVGVLWDNVLVFHTYFRNDTIRQADNSSAAMFVVHLEFETNVSVPYNVSVLDDILALHGEHVTVGLANGSAAFDIELGDLERPVAVDNIPTILGHILAADNFTGKVDLSATGDNSTTVMLPWLHCPIVTIPEWYGIEDIPGGIYVEMWDRILTRKQYLVAGESETDGVSICKNDFDDIIRSLPDRRSAGVSLVTPESVLGFVCTCLSILFASITFVIYAMIRELRTQPGINNMCLCACLVCAQTLLLVSSFLQHSIADWACKLLGILVHFMWLNVFAWLSVCCFHMFRTFKSTSVTARFLSKTKTTTTYAVYCFLTSAVPVGINILSRMDTDFGYDVTVYCYISRPRMIGFTFALPVGIILITNLVLFVIVVCKISTTPDVKSSSKRERNFLKIYAKLSTITGLSWLFGFLFQFTRFVVLEYIFIVLSAGQGIAIFAAFMFNQRVLGYVRSRITGEEFNSSIGARVSTKKEIIGQIEEGENLVDFRPVQPKNVCLIRNTNTRDDPEILGKCV